MRFLRNNEVTLSVIPQSDATALPPARQLSRLGKATQNPWLHRFAVLTAVATFFLLAVGGLVTSHGVGMAVPDWPNTYGYNMFLFPISKWVGGVFYEHSHRLIASMVGLLTSVLAVWLWVRETRRKARWIGVGLFVLALALMGARQLPV